MIDKEKKKLNSLINLAKQRATNCKNMGHQYSVVAECLQECELHIDYYGPSRLCLNRNEVLYTFKSDDEYVCEGLRLHNKTLVELCVDLIEDEYDLSRDENGEVFLQIKEVARVSKLPSAPRFSFEKIESVLIEHLSSASNVIFAAVAWFTNKKIFEILNNKAASGVVVYVIIDDNEQNRRLFNENSIIRFPLFKVENFSSEFSHMHHKFCIIDFNTVLHGTYNWTNNAEYNDEDIAIDKNESTVVAFMYRFNELLAKYHCYSKSEK